MSDSRLQPISSLYVHVPFCAHKCEYCAFYSEAARIETIDRYVGALELELKLVAPSLAPPLRTVFFGGGTPSMLSMTHWRRILETMEHLHLLGAEEWTIECNPATVTADKARLWRDYGVNRISMGIQSLDEDLLERLGRVHSRERVFKSYDLLRHAGFANINLDLMFALPSQTMAVWNQTLSETIALGSEHLSCYEVIYEEDTPLFAQLKAGEFGLDEDLACDMYDALREATQRGGFIQYEVANFAKDPGVSGPSDGEGSNDGPPRIPMRACQHNVNYWRGGPFEALGPSASGYVAGVRTKNWSNTDLYCDQLEKGRRAIESHETLLPLARAGEIAAFGLRMNHGWPFSEFASATGFDLRSEWRSEMNELVTRGWGQCWEESFALTSEGLRFADGAAEMFLR